MIRRVVRKCKRRYPIGLNVFLIAIAGVGVTSGSAAEGESSQRGSLLSTMSERISDLAAPYLSSERYLKVKDDTPTQFPRYGAATFEVNVSQALDQETVFSVKTADESAVAGLDYRAVGYDLTVPSGATSFLVSVPVIRDRLHEVDRPRSSFRVSVTRKSGNPVRTLSHAVTLDAGPRSWKNVKGVLPACALLQDGKVKCWVGTPNDSLGLNGSVEAVASGWGYTCALLKFGRVKCWGENGFGELGDGTQEKRETPTDVKGLTKPAIALALGEHHSCALLNDGTVRCWGQNFAGELGVDEPETSSAPLEVSNLSNSVTALTAGNNHTCALLKDGAVKCWGSNRYGQVGDGTTRSRSVPVSVSGLSSGVRAIAAGNQHTCALLSDGGIKCWGNNDYGQVGDGSNLDRTTPVMVSDLGSGVKALTVGAEHTCALLEAGGVKCWGGNRHGQVGDGTGEDRLAPVAVSGLMGDVSRMSASGNLTCAWGKNEANAPWCWGRGYGYLDTNYISQPSSLSGTQGPPIRNCVDCQKIICTLQSSGAVLCSGDNFFGQMGDGTREKRTVPASPLGLSSGVTALVSGKDHHCALLTGGGVKCWGYNSSGQLGDGSRRESSVPIDVLGLNRGVREIVARGEQTCAILASGGSTLCWGLNSGGASGAGPSQAGWIPTPLTEPL